MRVILADAESGDEVRELYASAPLGNYSYDTFTTYR